MTKAQEQALTSKLILIADRLEECAEQSVELLRQASQVIEMLGSVVVVLEKHKNP